jgi:hypothetical protein
MDGSDFASCIYLNRNVELKFISLDFVVISDNGQLKTVGEDIQGLDNKLFERALHDYLEDRPDQVGHPRL